MTAEAECVGHCGTNLARLSLIEREVELRIDVGIVGEVVDCGRDDTILDCLDASDSLKSASSAEKVTSH